MLRYIHKYIHTVPSQNIPDWLQRYSSFWFLSSGVLGLYVVLVSIDLHWVLASKNQVVLSKAPCLDRVSDDALLASCNGGVIVTCAPQEICPGRLDGEKTPETPNETCGKKQRREPGGLISDFFLHPFE